MTTDLYITLFYDKFLFACYTLNIMAQFLKERRIKMEEVLLQNISPYVRRLNYLKTNNLFGTWQDFDHSFTVIAQGEADFYINEIKYHLVEGDVIIIPPFCKHMIISSGILQQLIFHFDFFYDKNRENLSGESAVREAPDCEKILNDRVLVVHSTYDNFTKLKSLYFKMHHEELSKEPFYKLVEKSLCIQMLILFLKSQQKVYSPSNGKNRLKVQRTVEYIQQNYNNPDLNNDMIADAVGVSSKYLSDIFRQEMGIQIHKYLNFVRVESAQHLALSGEMNITEIADAVGYNSIHTFSKIFKKVTGLTPTEFLDANVPDIESIYQK